MTDKRPQGDPRHLFFIPSFYGALAWGIWLALYLMKLVRVDPCSNAALALYLLVEAFFVLSAIAALPRYTAVLQRRDVTGVNGGESAERPGAAGTLLFALHGAGFAGLALYVLEFSRNLGGIQGFILALVSEAYAIRWEMETSSSVGTQLSYFGWVAISLTVYHVARRTLPRWWMALAFLQFLGNFLFIDRTRPLWIIFTSLVMLLPVVRRLELRLIVRWMAGSCLVAVVLFWLVAEWTGKAGSADQYEDSVLPGITQQVYLYGVSGFAYFSRMLESNEQISYKPVRFLYPGLKYLARFGMVEEPPNQVLEFYDVPFPTNVGTFLEPFYRDGGFLFVLCGIIIYSFGFDCVGLLLLRGGRSLALYAWANLCFATFIGFFTPKISSFPIWLFMVMGMASLLHALSSSGLPADRGRQEHDCA